MHAIGFFHKKKRTKSWQAAIDGPNDVFIGQRSVPMTSRGSGPDYSLLTTSTHRCRAAASREDVVARSVCRLDPVGSDSSSYRAY